MRIYKDIDGDSSVYAYELGPDYIDVQFERTSKVYRYSYQSAGRDNVERMKVLADAGNGLNAYINEYVKYRYQR